MPNPAIVRVLDCIGKMIRCSVARSKVAILVYHRISPELFDSHVKLLARHYHIIAHDQLVDAIRLGDWSGIPPRSLVIHFDDGDKNVAKLEPVLRKHGMPVTQFLVSGGVSTKRRYWFTGVGAAHKSELKRMNQKERLAWLKENVGYEPCREYIDRQMLSREEVLCLMQVGIQCGGHTITHEELPTCEDSVAWEEIAGSKAQLEEMLGIPIVHFAYPSGRYSGRDVEYVRLAGFRSARTMTRGWNNVHSDVFRLKVLGPGDDMMVSQLGHLEVISLARRVVKAFDERKRRCRHVLARWMQKTGGRHGGCA